MTIKNLYPSQRPSIIYNVINGRKELPVNATFSRDSEAWYTNSAGEVVKAGINEPRFNYDASQNPPKFQGLLLENDRRNYVLGSNTDSFTAAINTDGNSFIDGINSKIVKYQNSNDAPNRPVTLPKQPTGQRVCGSIYIDPNQSDEQTNLVIIPIWNGSNNVAPKFKFDITEVSAGIKEVTNIRRVDTASGWRDSIFTIERHTNNIVRLGVSSIPTNSITKGVRLYMFLPSTGEGICVSAPQIELETERPTTFIVTPPRSAGDGVADALSLTTTTVFDTGFSLLLDSQTTTEDFIYKIKADGSDIASLSNDDGTLDWTINGKSAAINGEYPQVGFLPGRVRTVSSFGPAEQGDVENYLYTTGLSFPTAAEPAAGADEIEFGTPQTLKALYVWDGQLDETNAVSLIRGKYNVVPNEPIATNSFSFVYNTDPTNEGNLNITLPYIVPTVSMRVDWGDGNSNAYEKGIVPSHTYPYPGQYRIQIEADDGFDLTRLGDVGNTIYRVDQWAPQFRVGQSPGFTGDQLRYLLYLNYTNKSIPPFAYTDLTDLSYAFYAAGNDVPVNGWNFIPTELTKCTSLNNAFVQLCRNTSGPENERNSFPKLETSSALTNVVSCFMNMDINSFPDGLPFRNTENVTSWSSCFENTALLSIGPIDTRNAGSISKIFKKTPLTSMPLIETQNVENFNEAWRECKSLAAFPQINTSKGETFSYAWYQCQSLTAFPQIDTSNAIDFGYAWSGCEGLISFPSINTSKVQSMYNTWAGCKNLTSFPLIDTSSCTTIEGAWNGCENIEGAFPAIDTSLSNSFGGVFTGCKKITSHPAYSTEKCGRFNNCWQQNESITSFPKISFRNANDVRYAWFACNQLADFEAGVFDDWAADRGGVDTKAFFQTFGGNALTVQSVENIIVSLDRSGWSDIELAISGGTTADYKDWTEAAKTALQNLIDKNWDVSINDSEGSSPAAVLATSGFYINHQDGVVAFGEINPDIRHISGKDNKEVCADEGEAIARVLEIDKDYFSTWDRESRYFAGDRVKFGTCIFRALQDHNASSFELPNVILDPGAEIPTPMNRQAIWKMVCNPEFEKQITTVPNEEESY